MCNSKSLIYKEKSKGHKMEPCDTPHKTVLVLDLALLHVVNYLWLFR